MSIYNRLGVDFDNIFEPRQAGDPSIPIAGYDDENDIDLSLVYAPAAIGNPGPNVLYHRNGVDIGPMFAVLGSRPPAVALNIASDYSATDTKPPGGSALASVSFQADGLAVVTSGGSTAWVTPGSASADYEFFGSGLSVAGSPTGVWVSNPVWSLAQNTGGINIGDLSVQVRRVSDQVVVANSTLHFNAEVGIG